MPLDLARSLNTLQRSTGDEGKGKGSVAEAEGPQPFFPRPPRHVPRHHGEGTYYYSNSFMAASGATTRDDFPRRRDTHTPIERH
eukprot:scaffold118745_cov37-Tisochrysis_lutea.AAC.1